MKWLKGILGLPVEDKETEPEKKVKVSAELVHANGEMITVVGSGDKADIFALHNLPDDKDLTSGVITDQALGAGAGAVSDLDPTQASVPVSTQPRDRDPTLLGSAPPSLALAQTPPPVLTLDPAPIPPNKNLNNTIIEPIINLVNSIFDEEKSKNYFFSIFIPPEDDSKKKSTASSPSSEPILTSELREELKKTLEQCAGAYISGDNDLTLSDSSDPQSGSTKITSTSSTSKAEPPVYFGVGIKTELAEDGDKKFLKITEIFSNSNLRKEKQGDNDYTNNFITHLNCKLNDGEEAEEHSITDIFNKFKGDPNQKEKFDEKIDQIFRDLKKTSIKFKISADISQTDSTTQLAEVTVNKIIFEKKSDGAYKQKTTTPSTITANRKASIAAAKQEGKAV